MPAALSRARVRALWERGQRGWPTRYVLVQFPNVPLLVSLAASLLVDLTHGRVSEYADAVSRVALAAFAYLELADGVNLFRRLLGAAVLVSLVVGIAHDLHGS